jgi:hypothetical protein
VERVALARRGGYCRCGPPVQRASTGRAARKEKAEEEEEEEKD